MTIIVGLEGVLARHEWRQPLIEAEGWPAYHQAAERDEPNGSLVQIVNALHAKGNTVYCITDRPEPWRGMTISWMAKHGIMVDWLLMRGDKDFRKSEELRTECTKGILLVAKEVLIAIDESDKACDVYRAAGIPTLQVFNPNGAA